MNEYAVKLPDVEDAQVFEAEYYQIVDGNILFYAYPGHLTATVAWGRWIWVQKMEVDTTGVIG